MEVSLRDMGFGDDNPLISAVLDMIEFADEATEEPETRHHHPSRAYIRETRAMKNTPADVVELPASYQYLIDMPGLKSEEVKVQVEDDTVLVVNGERRRRKEKAEGVKYLRMERRYGKFMKKFMLPENANREKVEARFENGVLTVAVEKTPPPEPKKVKVIEVKIGGGGGGGETSGAGGEGLKHESDENHGEGSKEESQTAAQI